MNLIAVRLLLCGDREKLVKRATWINGNDVARANMLKLHVIDEDEIPQ